MATITRDGLKNNFLKNTILRLDFQNVLEKDMETIVSLVKEYAKNRDFNKYEEKMSGDINVNVNENAFGAPDVTTNIANERKIFCFNNEAGYTIELSDAFVVLQLESTGYIPFEENLKTLLDIIKIFSGNSGFFTEKRFGIRKINKCILQKQTTLERFFKPNAINFYDVEKGRNVASRHSDTIIYDCYQVNYNRSLLQGTANGATLYQVELDIDAYMQETNLIKNVLYSKEKISELNNTIFEIFINSLTDEMATALCKDDFDLSEIIGVESNE